jgi:hypothetical protein
MDKVRCRVFHSLNPSLLQAMEEIHTQFQADRQIDTFDFILIALSCRYPVWDVNETVSQVFETDRFLAFHATDAFNNEEVIHHGVTALFIRFERQGGVECFVQEGVSANKLDALEKTARYLKERDHAFHLIIAGHCHNQTAFFIEKLNQYDIAVDNLLGGVSSGEKISDELLTYQFYKGEVVRDGFVILTFHHVKMATSVALGFEPVGVQYTVTKAKGYRLYQVDDHQSFAYTVEKLKRGIENFKPEYFWYTPIVVLDESNEKFLTLRTFKEQTNDWVEFFGPVKEGQKIRLSYGEKENLLAADTKSATTLAAQVPDPEILFNFSCTARQYVLEEMQKEENRIYRNFLHAPLFGFFTFGEIGHDPSRRSLQFYNETSLLMGMTEL